MVKDTIKQASWRRKWPPPDHDYPKIGILTNALGLERVGDSSMLLRGHRYMLTYRYALAQGVGVTVVRYIGEVLCESSRKGARSRR